MRMLCGDNAYPVLNVYNVYVITMKWGGSVTMTKVLFIHTIQPYVTPSLGVQNFRRKSCIPP